MTFLPTTHIKKKQAILYLILANIIWGATSPIIKLSLESIDPFVFLFLRFFVASFLFLPLAANKLSIQRKDYGMLLATSLSGGALTIMLLLLGLPYTSSINAPIIGASGPVFLLIFASILFHEKLRRKTLIGTFVSLLGVLIIVFQPTPIEQTKGFLLGNVYLLLSTLSGVIHTFLLKKMITRYSLFSLNFWSSILSALFLMPLALFSTYQYGFLPNITFAGASGLLFTIIFSSAVAFTLFALGVNKLKVNETGIFAYVAPFSAIVVAIPLLGESITPLYLLGGFFIFLGISIVQMKIKFHPFHSIKYS